jgi:putative transposase
MITASHDAACPEAPGSHGPAGAIQPRGYHFVTVCTKDRKPILANPDSARALKEAWSKESEWSVGQYVIMPDHVHLFCAPATDPRDSLADWIRRWKSSTARSWPKPADVPIWQRHYWDRQLRSGESYSNKWHYVLQNPVRAGLIGSAEEWPFQGEMNVLSWQADETSSSLQFIALELCRIGIRPRAIFLG